MAAVLHIPVCHEPFQFPYSHRLALYAEDTAAFTLCLLRAHPAADSRKRRVTGYDRSCTGEISGSHMRYKLRYAYVYRTCRHTAWIPAVQAAARFKLRLLCVISVTYFIEIGRPVLRILFSDRDSRYPVCHYLPLPILHLCS